MTLKTIHTLPALQMIGFGLLAFILKIITNTSGNYHLVAREWLSLLIALVGLTLLGSSGVLFKRYNTTINPFEPDKASTLVISGWYRWTRNPMYLGFLSVLIAWTLYLANAYALLVTPLFILSINHFNIIPEEKALHHRFGDAYDRYKQRVRRWI